MAIVFVKRKAGGGKSKISGSAFERWYKGHREAFNERRRQRYHTDKEYRNRVLAEARKTREARRHAADKPKEYQYTLTDAADALGVTIWTLRNWRVNHYFPEPLKFNGEVWLTGKQVELLAMIKDYLTRHGIRRLSAAQRAELDLIVQNIHANWGPHGDNRQ